MSARVAAHVHSEWSYDAHWKLPDVARLFGRFGYEAVLMAEHDRDFDQGRWEAYKNACAVASTERTVLVPGIEYSDSRNVVHVPVWGSVPFLGRDLDTSELLRRVREHRGVAILAHPDRRGVGRNADPDWSAYLLGVELWNRRYDGYAPSTTAAALLAEAKHLIPFVGTDFHSPRQLFPLTMRLAVERPLSLDSVYGALRQGRCMARACGVPTAALAHRPALGAMRAAERARQRLARELRRSRRHRDRKSHRAGSDHPSQRR